MIPNHETICSRKGAKAQSAEELNHEGHKEHEEEERDTAGQNPFILSWCSSCSLWLLFSLRRGGFA
jgi:hypothetical protein